MMKTFLLTLLIFPIIMLNAQNNDYADQWKKVEGLEKKGLTKSAAAEVESIFIRGVKDKNDVQQVKAAMYQMKYRNMVEEDSRANNVFYLDTLINQAKAPVKQILYSMQAELLVAYKRENRWKLYNRTQLSNEDSTDLQTWSIEKLNKEIEEKYKLSIQQSALLQRTKLEGFDAIISKGENSRQLRPTLYDLLAHRALDYFMNDENDIVDPSYKFIISDPRYFEPAKSFISLHLQTKDTTSNYYQALKIFQEILAFHLADKSPEALLDADLKRLEFVKDRGVFPDKNKLFEQALLDLERQYNAKMDLPVKLRLSQFYFELATSFENDAENKSLKNDNPYFVKAENIAEEIIKEAAGSNEAIRASNLLVQIRRPIFSIETEKALEPGLPFKSFVSYKNINKLYLRILRVDEDQLRRLENLRQNRENALFNYLSSLPVTRQWEQALPLSPQRTNKTAEFISDALPAGHYIFAASMNDNFQTVHNLLSFAQIEVSSISYIYNNQQSLYVLNRNSGEPMPGSQVQVWRKNFDYKNRSFTYAKITEYTADKNGMVKQALNDRENRYQRFLKIINGKEELISDDQYFSYRYDYNQPEKPSTQVFLFTDRSIYRPGQTVFFKGIAISRSEKGRKNEVITDYNANVQLFDANGQRVSSLKLKTNRFGSYNGSFVLPSGILNGSFQLVDSGSNGSKSIQVEEYKRPKFFVAVKKPEGTYRLNDTISVKGKAEAYAGNNIDGAVVKYRVVRKVNFPPWFRGYFRPWPPYGQNRMELANGETKTNAAGEFEIFFKAIPDETVEKKDQPVFHYEITTDVTDLNGETHTATQTVAVAYQALQLSIDAESPMPADSLKKIRIYSRNMNNLHEKTRVQVQVFSLQEPGKVFKSRYWQVPDTVLISKSEFEKLFPYDAYGNEDKIESWPIAKKVLEASESTDSTGKFPFPSTTVAAGWYKIVVTTKDRFGEEVKAEQFFNIQSASDSKTNQPLIISIEKDSVKPGEKTRYAVNTGFDKVWLIHTVSKTGERQEVVYPAISQAKGYNNSIQVLENDRGGVAINIAFVKHNRVYTGSDIIHVPWSNKELQISYETFRAKLLPGAEEKWTVKITGPAADKVAAETLVSMYDASLDQFIPHRWQSLQSLWPVMGNNIHWTTASFASQSMNSFVNINENYREEKPMTYDQLKNEGWGAFYTMFERGQMSDAVVTGYGRQRKGELAMDAAAMAPQAEMKSVASTAKVEEVADTTTVVNALPVPESPNSQIRKNFNETAFFFPDLVTNENGEVSFSFTIPEALTTWKLMTMAHNTGLASVYGEKTIVTQKPLMVQPNAPRFMREGDDMEFTAKVVNMSAVEITGVAELELIDAGTNTPVDGWFKNQFPKQYFTAAAGQSLLVSFPISIPYEFQSSLLYRIKAQSNKVKTANGEESFTDGEEMALPVLTNRTLVTESMPLNMKGTGTQQFQFDKLLKSSNSNTLTHKAVTVEYSSNPVWYAVQALPYLMEYPYDCAEQVFNRFYANALASHITSKMPKIKAVLDQWGKDSSATSALISNLEKNHELKSALLEETPWVMDAKNETQQKKNIALLFDLVRIAKEKTVAIDKLKEMQMTDGSFPWFRGGYSDRYITQYIVAGIGHLQKLSAMSKEDWSRVQPILNKALPYLDAMASKDYEVLKRSKIKLTENHLQYISAHYLYARTFFDNKFNNRDKPAFDYYKGQAEKYWLSGSRYMQSMIALALERTGNSRSAKDIVTSLKENAIQHPELGMYWKELNGGYYWYQAPVEIQSVIIEAFNDIANDRSSVDEMKTWLLKQKQVQGWRSTKATADAIYALLLSGTDWMDINRTVNIRVGEYTVKTDQPQAATGYIKETITGRDVKPAMGNISITVSGDGKDKQTGISWGAVYWQYFEQLDKITTAQTPLSLKKQLFVETNSAKGPVLTPLREGDNLKVGDKVRVRIELRVDRDMEYIHLKDMRAAAFEPTNVISGFKWQGGLGYYESTKDASTNFFFNRLPRGTFVFEYPMFVTHAGNFSNGITTIQSMYAPEYSSHSEGIRVKVEDR